MKGRLSPALGLGLGLTTGIALLYAVTLTPGVPPTDSGELALAAWLPGVAHAPGFPSWVALGWLWSHLLPFGRVIWRLNLLSAICGALAVGLAYLLTLHTLRREEGDRTAWLGAATGALALGVGRTVWLWATVAEVYVLNLALSAAVLLLVVRWTGMETSKSQTVHRTSEIMPRDSRVRKARARPRGSQSPAAPRASSQSATRSPLDAPPIQFRAPWSLIIAAFLFGLGLGAHLTSTALLAPAIAYWLTAHRGWRFWLSKTMWLAALALIAGAAIYLYLPLVASTDPLLNWGQPDTWQRFWWHVSAKQYRVSLLSAPVWPQVVLAGRLWWTQFTPVGLALIGLGIWRMAQLQRRLLVALILVGICTTLYAWAYVIEDDQDAYYLPAFFAGAAWLAWGAQGLAQWLHLRLIRIFATESPTHADVHDSQAGWRVTTAICLLVPALALAMNWSTCSRQADTIPDDYLHDSLAEIGPRGLLLTRDWQFYAPALYAQYVEGLRPDLTVIDTELLRRNWYFDFLHRADPALMAAVAREERAFLVVRDAWERGEISDSDPRIGQLQAGYVALIDALIRAADATGRPVHIGPNRGAESLRGATLAGIPDMEPGVGARWRWLPVGLSFRAASATAPAVTLPPLHWQIEAFRNTVPTAPERKVQATRADMATLRGLYQANTGNPVGAQADLQVALAVDPGHGAAREIAEKLRAGR